MALTPDKEHSPFKFLDPYDIQDTEYFHGREEEEGKLYDIVNQNRLVLVYGKLGTGKTSLVRCGLAKHFDNNDWLPLYISRGKNINDSFRSAIQATTRSEPDTDPPSLLSLLEQT